MECADPDITIHDARRHGASYADTFGPPLAARAVLSKVQLYNYSTAVQCTTSERRSPHATTPGHHAKADMSSSPAELAPAAPVADAAAYARDGFLILPEPVVSPALLQRAVAGMEAVRHGEYDTGRPCVGSNSLPAREENRGMAPGAGNDTDTLCKMELPQQANHALREVVSLEAIGRLAAEATGATWVQVWWTQLLGKPASGGTETGESTTNIGFHQDRNYWQGNWEEGSELLTAWVALSNVAEDGGPMRFVRRSNNWGLLGEEANFFHMHDLES
eukprot:SAG22_NODE_3658_length_1590_cov_1.552649_1_plen_275_part_10